MGCKEQSRIDLHIHSTASDGTLSPIEILDMARDRDLGAIAITDHDTVEGSREALEAWEPSTFSFLTGVEISAATLPSFPCSGSFHILGYGIRVDDPILNQTLDVLQEARKNRNPEIIERLKGMGFDISMDEVRDNYGEGLLGRPHIARLMVKKGFTKSINETFDFYLGKGKPAYVDKYRINPERAIEVSVGAGGVPVLAHPALLDPATDEPLENLLRDLKAFGLMGVEVHYPAHTRERTAQFIEMAEHFDLLMTGGTDFHGSLKPDVEMGSGEGGLHVPYSLYEKLMEKLASKTSRSGSGFPKTRPE